MNKFTPGSIAATLFLCSIFFQLDALSHDAVAEAQFVTGTNVLGIVLIVAALALGYFARERYDRYVEDKNQEE